MNYRTQFAIRAFATISPPYSWQRGLLRRRQTEQKTTNMNLPVCSQRWCLKSNLCLLASLPGDH